MSAGRQRFYVTTPIYYVNSAPHIGHAFTTLLADVLSRTHRLMGVPTWFLTGTDEHGAKVQQAAQKAGVTPQRHADDTVVRFIDLWKKLGITCDDFIRTTEERHKSVVQRILQDLYDRDEIYRGEYDGWYCVACERFFTDKDLVDGKCPEKSCGRDVERLTEANYFFRMSRYQDWLVEYIKANPRFIMPESRRNETLGFLRKPLNDLCIGRPKSRLSWGIELPFDRNYVVYVWFDALVNYISAIGYTADETLFRRWWPATCQLIGKDILTTHTVYWPTMLRAMGLPMPETVFAHGWWLAGESKMSKTAGNVVNPMEYMDAYGVDAFRYFLMAEMVLGQDASFTDEAFIRRYNVDLANDLGNITSRVHKMISGYCGGVVPSPGEGGEDEAKLRGSALAAAAAMESGMADMRTDQWMAAVMATMREANRYIERCQPWTLAKEGNSSRLHTVLYHAAETLRIASGLLYPVMPGKMIELRRAMGLGEEQPVLEKLLVWGGLKPGTRIGPPTILFPRIVPRDASAAAAAAETAKAQEAGTQPGGTAMIEYADFQKVELRTAKVVAAEKVAGADRLLRVEVEIGTERRQLVAGIAAHYTPENIIGRTVVVVANLKPAVIRGVESAGMILAAVGEGGKLNIVVVDGDAPSGAVVK